ncbi:MAG: hypothetical protein LBT71_06310 [Azoarcus sp.]|jgi:hypothetical protein|nr:hypothetical protein [Azoarcus sp.]
MRNSPDPDLLSRRPYWQYQHSDGIKHPRLLHKAWGDTRLTLRHDHPFWQTHFPPNGWGCGCTVKAVRTPADGAATAPPDGWDAINPQTGEPAGIDKGWGYAPGASVADELRNFVAEKAAKLPRPLRHDFLAAISDGTGIKIDAASIAAKAAQIPERPGLDRNATRYVLARGHKDGKEHLYAYDAKTGKNVIQNTTNSRNAVTLPARVSTMLDTPGAAMVLHHNHPDSVSLSPRDLGFLARPGGHRVVAHGHDGSMFSAAKGDGVARLEIAINAARAEIRSQARTRGIDLGDWLPHLVNMSLSRAGIIRYNFSLAPSQNTAYVKYAVIFEKILAEAVAAIARAKR